jgi:hypothetical protein
MCGNIQRQCSDASVKLYFYPFKVDHESRLYVHHNRILYFIVRSSVLWVTVCVMFFLGRLYVPWLMIGKDLKMVLRYIRLLYA